MQIGFQKPMKDKFSALKTKVWNESHIVWEPFQTPIFQQYKALHDNIEKILRENLRFTRNSGSKRKLFTKHAQVNFILIETFFGLDPRVLKFTNHFCLVVNRFN